MVIRIFSNLIRKMVKRIFARFVDFSLICFLKIKIIFPICKFVIVNVIHNRKRRRKISFTLPLF